MTICKNKIQKNFSRAAKTYDNAGEIQAKTARVLMESIKSHVNGEVKTILDIGAGTGFATQELFKLYPAATYTLNDISPEMLGKAAEKFQPFPNILFSQGDAESTSFAHVDLTIANLSFQWLKNLKQALSKFWKNTHILAFSIPCQGSFSEWARIHTLLQLPSPLLALPTYTVAQGLCEKLQPQMFWHTSQKFTISFSHPRECLHYFQALGVNSSRVTHSIGALRKIYDPKHPPLSLNYNVFFGVLAKS